MNHYDILVIGGGPGGMGAALRAAELGRKTALVERAELGGVCLNWGCIPTKALLKSAQVYHYCRTADAFGVTLGGEAKPDMARIVARSRGVSETMRKGVGFLLEKNKVDVLRGEARLAGEGRVIVADETVSADHIILATGARPREMPFMPIDHEHVLSSRDALVLDELPESMVVVGSGAIGCEFASFYAALGVRGRVPAAVDAARRRGGGADDGAGFPQTAHCGDDLHDGQVRDGRRRGSVPRAHRRQEG